MSSLNQITLLGNVGNDPEQRQVGDSAVTAFSLATSRQWKGRDGSKQEKTEWHRCQAWNMGTNKLADIAAQYLRKGDKVLVVGSLEYRDWEKDGVKRTAAEIRVSDIRRMGGKRDAAAPAARSVSEVLAPDEDDLPF